MPTDTHKLRYHEDGCTWMLPEVLRFGAGHYFYEVLGFRPPKAGEWFLSGAIIEAYKTHNNGIETPYLIVRPTHHAISVIEWRRGKELTP